MNLHERCNMCVTFSYPYVSEAAGSKHVINLHGKNDICVCMSCGYSIGRAQFHGEILEPANLNWMGKVAASGDMNADGDAELSADFSNFVIPGELLSS